MPLRYLREVRRHFTLTALAVGMVVLTAPAHAQVWNEVGDAGPFPATAQQTVGAGLLTTIRGNLASASDVDMYCIHLGSAPPANSPLLGLQCVIHQGPDVWLFDANGKGVLAATACQGGEKRVIAPNISLAPGDYYVAVSNYGVDPYAGPNAIWLPSTSTSHAPDGPGAAGTLNAWTGLGQPGPLNPYQINLFAGITFCSGAVPARRQTWGTLKIRYGN